MSTKQLLKLILDKLESLQNRPVFRRKDIALRYGVCLRTVDYWSEQKKLPKPVYVHGPMWRPSDIESMELKKHGTKHPRKPRAASS